MALADIMNSRATFLLLLITLFGGCKTSQTQKGISELDENFHYGVPYEEVMKKSGHQTSQISFVTKVGISSTIMKKRERT